MNDQTCWKVEFWFWHSGAKAKYFEKYEDAWDFYKNPPDILGVLAPTPISVFEMIAEMSKCTGE